MKEIFNRGLKRQTFGDGDALLQTKEEGYQRRLRSLRIEIILGRIKICRKK